MSFSPKTGMLYINTLHLGMTYEAGDPPKLGDYPDATAVYDVDSIGLIRIMSHLNHGCDLAGNPIGGATNNTYVATATGWSTRSSTTSPCACTSPQPMRPPRSTSH